MKEKISLKIERMLSLVDSDALLIKTCEELNELSHAISKYVYLKKIIPQKTQVLDFQSKEIFEELCDVKLCLKYVRRIFDFNNNHNISEKNHEKIDKAIKFLEEL